MSVSTKPMTFAEGGWDTNILYLNNVEFDYGNNDYGYVRFYLNDGTSITTNILTSSNTNKRLALSIDINGNKKPNKMGKDIFQYNYYIYNSTKPELTGKIAPTSYFKDREYLLTGSQHSCNKESTGALCATLIMHDSWQIKDDYPW